MAEEQPATGLREQDAESFRLTRDAADRGPSLAERLSDRLDRLSFASPFHRMRLKGRFPLKLLGVPVDPVPGDPGRAQRLKGGRLFRDGYGQGMLEARLDAPDAPESWRNWVHGWGWLRDLAAATDLTRAEAQRSEALAKRWLTRFHEYDEQAWAPALTGRRILMAISHAPLVMPGHDHIHRSAVLNGIARWARHLDRAAPRMAASFGRAEAAAGLMGSALMLPGAEDQLGRAEQLLEATVAELLMADGSAASRSPLDLANLAELMAWLAAFHKARGKATSRIVAETLERTRTALGSLAMGDGLCASWHGGQPTRAQMERVAPPRKDAAGPGKASGFHRMVAGGTIIVADVGPPPLARNSPSAHASTLAFSLSDGTHPLIISCGGDRGTEGPRVLPAELVMGLRSTAGHSALVLADTNSSRLADGSARRSGGVEEVLVEARSSSQGHWLEARHDGWRRRFGLDQLRRLWLSPDGADLRGEDRLLPVRGNLSLKRADRLPVAIRFHLGLGVEATLTQDGKGALIHLPGGPRQPDIAWAFRSSFNHAPGMVSIEPSLFIDAEGVAHEIRQILLTSLVEPGAGLDIGWSLKRQSTRR